MKKFDVLKSKLGLHSGWKNDSQWVIAALKVYFIIRIVGFIFLYINSWVVQADFNHTLTRWDGQWFLNIASHGYRDIDPTLHDSHFQRSEFTGYAFFPGFPYLFRVFNFIVPLPAQWAAVIFNGICAAIAALGVYQLTVICVRKFPALAQPEKVYGLTAVALFSALPLSVVYYLPYSEALYLAATSWSLVFMLRGKWILSGALCSLAGITRTSAVAIVAVIGIAALVSLWKAYQNKQRYWPQLLCILLAPLGWIAYLMWVGYRQGTPLGWFTIQKDGWGSKIDLGIGTTQFLYRIFFSVREVENFLIAIIIIAAFVLIIASWKYKLPWQITLYSLFAFLSVYLSNGLMSSKARLMLAAFTLVIPLAIKILSFQRRRYWISLALFIIFGIWFGAHMIVVYPNAI